MKKLTLLGIIGGAALLTAAPFSLQWSQKNVPLSLESAEARIGRPLTATCVAGVSRRVHRRAYRRAVYGTALPDTYHLTATRHLTPTRPTVTPHLTGSATPHRTSATPARSVISRAVNCAALAGIDLIQRH